MYRVKRNKYNAKSSYYGGYWYQSNLEASYAVELDLRLKAKDIKEWERQVRLPLKVNDVKICDYIIDFKILHNDNSIEWVEVKGLELPAFRIKWKLFEALYPDDVKTIIKANYFRK